MLIINFLNFLCFITLKISKTLSIEFQQFEFYQNFEMYRYTAGYLKLAIIVLSYSSLFEILPRSLYFSFLQV